MVTLANELQPLKAKFPIPITELGMLTLANELQPLKAKFPIPVTDLECSRLPMSCSLQRHHLLPLSRSWE